MALIKIAFFIYNTHKVEYCVSVNIQKLGRPWVSWLIMALLEGKP